jgi:hypothetical protein
MKLSERELVDLFGICYTVIYNDEVLAKSIGSVSGKGFRDYYSNDGKVSYHAWIPVTREENILHLPDAYGKTMTARVRDMWGTLLARFSKPGYYYLNFGEIPMLRLDIDVEYDKNILGDYEIAVDILNNILVSNVSLESEYLDSQDIFGSIFKLDIGDITDVPPDRILLMTRDILRRSPSEIPDLDKKLAYAQKLPYSKLLSFSRKALRGHSSIH